LVTFLATLLSYIFVNARTKSLATIKNLRESSEKIMELATHDILTGLPNRGLFISQFEQIMSLAMRNKKFAALMFVDLDKFKSINDTYGHQVGDELLKQVSERMGHCVRTEDSIGRQGGDEFLIGI
jgi:diguanylate cyclase (GGDEF)-like protein